MPFTTGYGMRNAEATKYLLLPRSSMVGTRKTKSKTIHGKELLVACDVCHGIHLKDQCNLSVLQDSHQSNTGTTTSTTTVTNTSNSISASASTSANNTISPASNSNSNNQVC